MSKIFRNYKWKKLYPELFPEKQLFPELFPENNLVGGVLGLGLGLGLVFWKKLFFWI